EAACCSAWRFRRTLAHHHRPRATAGTDSIGGARAQSQKTGRAPALPAPSGRGSHTRHLEQDSAWASLRARSSRRSTGTACASATSAPPLRSGVVEVGQRVSQQQQLYRGGGRCAPLPRTIIRSPFRAQNRLRVIGLERLDRLSVAFPGLYGAGLSR